MRSCRPSSKQTPSVLSATAPLGMWFLLTLGTSLLVQCAGGCTVGEFNPPEPGLVFKCNVSLICGGVGNMVGTSQACITSQAAVEDQRAQVEAEVIAYGSTHCNGYAYNGDCYKTYQTCLDSDETETMTWHAN
jgi:hypothetical protein